VLGFTPTLGQVRVATLLIVDVVISGLNDFGNVGNVGHTNTINIGGVEVTIKPKAIEKVDWSLTLEHPNDVPLMHALEYPQVSSEELHGPQHQ
jgi:hypothetical protein